MTYDEVTTPMLVAVALALFCWLIRAHRIPGVVRRLLVRPVADETGTNSRAALDAYWAARTPDEERAAYARMKELGMYASSGEMFEPSIEPTKLKKYALEIHPTTSPTPISLWEMRDRRPIRCVAILKGGASATYEEALVMEHALNAMNKA